MTTNLTLLTDFSWKAFESTGSIEAYFLYRKLDERNKVLEESQTAVDEVAISF
ncbi:MAG: YqzL-like protein [Clostridiales bacterium]|nr:YqzL-like protein [Clostridiales bacterium]